jgi:putative ATPase
MPECSVHLTHAVVFLSLAPKSNALDAAYHAAARDAQETLAESVPLHIRNAPTRLMKELHYGEGYAYAHDYAEKMTPMICLPDALAHKTYYHPTESGREKGAKDVNERIKAWKKQAREQGWSGEESGEV